MWSAYVFQNNYKKKIEFFNPAANLMIINPVFSMDINAAGELKFTLEPNNIYEPYFVNVIGKVELYRDDVWIWGGMVDKVEKDTYGYTNVTCIGVIAYLQNMLAHVVRKPEMSIYSFLASIFNLNTTTSIYGMNGDGNNIPKFNVILTEASRARIKPRLGWSTILDCIKTNVTGLKPSYIEFSKTSNKDIFEIALSYKMFPEINSSTEVDHVIYVNKNLISYSRTLDSADIFTNVIPVGSSSSNETGSEDTTPSLHYSPIYTSCIDQSMDGQRIRNTYGTIYKLVQFSNIETSSDLRKLGNEYIKSATKRIMAAQATMNITALDMAYIDEYSTYMEIGDIVEVKSRAVDNTVKSVLTGYTLYLLGQSDDQYRFGLQDQLKYTENVLNGIDKEKAGKYGLIDWVDPTDDGGFEDE